MAIGVARLIATLLTLLTLLDFRTSPAIDLFFTARARAAGATTIVSGPKLQKAVDEVARLELILGGSAQWGIVEGALSGCDNAADIKRSFGYFPEEYVYGNQTLKLRSATLTLARALEAAEAEFMAGVWPKHKALIDKKRGAISRILDPKAAAWEASLTGALDVKPPPKPVLTYLVAEAPRPWGFTRLERGGQPMIVIGVGEVDGSTLAEMPVHELVHALDAREGSVRGALRELRLALEGVGIAQGSPESNQITHLLMYVASGEVMRRAVDGRHLHFGETYGTYGRMPEAAPALLEWWNRYLDGMIPREEAIRGFVQQYREGRK